MECIDSIYSFHFPGDINDVIYNRIEPLQTHPFSSLRETWGSPPISPSSPTRERIHSTKAGRSRAI